jgi:hypothetical protein
MPYHNQPMEFLLLPETSRSSQMNATAAQTASNYTRGGENHANSEAYQEHLNP